MDRLAPVSQVTTLEIEVRDKDGNIKIQRIVPAASTAGATPKE